MQSAPKPANEKKRLEVLQSLKILDTLPERDFDQITFLASQICDTPVALISLIDEERQWFKSKIGIEASETPRDLAFCAHAILEENIFIVPDATQDARFFDSPLVTSGPQIQFYAGAPLKSPDGHALGTVCVIDSKPRQLSPQQILALQSLSEQVTRLIELRLQIAALKKFQEQIQFKNKATDTILEGVVLQDKAGAIIDFNPAATAILGVSPEQLRGQKSLNPVTHAIKEDGSEFLASDQPASLCLQTGLAQKNVIMGIVNAHHQTTWIKINCVPLLQEGSATPSFSVTSFADITEEVRVKKDLEKQKADLRFILDGIPGMVGLWGTDQKNIQANSAYSDYFNKNPDQIHGLYLKELLGDQLYKQSQPYVNQVLSGKTVSFERMLPYKDGTLRHTLASYIPNFIDGQLVSFLAVIVDISEVKKLERDQRGLESRLAESAKLSALGEMAAGVAHEVNNPLAIIKGKAAMLIRKATELDFSKEAQLKELQSIEAMADRIAKIVKALKTYSRDAEKDDFVEANLFDILEDTLTLCGERFKQANVEIRINCPTSLNINCRPAQISQVIMNLLSNSFDAIASLKEKWIDVRGWSEAGKIYLQITDAGPGIPKAICEKMMRPFFTTKEVGKGTGLGLSISFGIMDTHEGSLRYKEDAPNTTFILSLPELEAK